MKVVITDADRSAAGTELVEQVKENIEGKRPIGADVTVVSAVEKSVSVTAKVRLQNGVNLGTVQELFLRDFTDYLRSGAFEISYVSLARTGNLLLGVTGWKILQS